jgi:hypothetical protein
LSRDDGLTEIKGRLFDLVGKIGSEEVPVLFSRAAVFIGSDGVHGSAVGRLSAFAPMYVPEWWTAPVSGTR